MLTASYYYSYWDPTYILIIIGAVISLLASARVKTTFSRFSMMRSACGMTGAEVAQRMLHMNGIYDVKVEHVSGSLTDHYNPSEKTLCLSDSVFDSTSVAALGVAAHECGHAVQHATGYAPLEFRSTLVPIANFGSKFSWIAIMAGVLLSWNQSLISFGILLFSLAVLFQLVTLPVEFNASSRALACLEQSGILSQSELPCAKKVLSSAALTYVAGAAASILQLLRLIILFGGRDRD